MSRSSRGGSDALLLTNGRTVAPPLGTQSNSYVAIAILYPHIAMR
jgi:hypothetical protein